MRQPKPNFLNRSERDTLDAKQRRERDKKICDRIRVILLLDKGWTYANIAKALFLEEGTVRRYYVIYIEKGEQELITLKYSGSTCELNKEQLDKVTKYVEESTPTSAVEVVYYIEKNFEVKYSVSAVVAILHRLGFIYKKPKLVPGKADPEKR